MGCEAQGFREAETTDLTATRHSDLQSQLQYLTKHNGSGCLYSCCVCVCLPHLAIFILLHGYHCPQSVSK